MWDNIVCQTWLHHTTKTQASTPLSPYHSWTRFSGKIKWCPGMLRPESSHALRICRSVATFRSAPQTFPPLPSPSPPRCHGKPAGRRRALSWIGLDISMCVAAISLCPVRILTALTRAQITAATLHLTTTLLDPHIVVTRSTTHVYCEDNQIYIVGTRVYRMMIFFLYFSVS